MINGELFGGARRPKIPRINVVEANYAFQCKAFRLPPVTEQYLFAESMGRKFRADFCFVDYKLIVEIFGGVWRRGGGAHSRPSSIERDMERSQYATLLGFYMVAFSPQDVTSGHAVDWTQRILYRHGWRPRS